MKQRAGWADVFSSPISMLLRGRCCVGVWLLGLMKRQPNLPRFVSEARRLPFLAAIGRRFLRLLRRCLDLHRHYVSGESIDMNFRNVF